ncbi:MAG: ABC transporter substrate-binding protein [Candidatus Glassbacteria bacterium]
MKSVLIVFLFCPVLISSCAQEKSTDEIVGKRILTIVLSSDILTLDPHIWDETLTHSVLKNMMEPLIKLDGDLKIDHESSIAEGWNNPDDHTWVFHIRSGVRFQNGKVLTAADVKASLERAKYHPLTDFGGGLGNIESISTKGDYTLVIKMRKPSAILPYILNSCMILSKEQAERWDVDELVEKPIGTGPYRLISWERGKSIRLKAFDNYWKGKPAFDRVVIIPESDSRKRVNMILNGEADLVVDIPVDVVDSLKERPDMRLISQESLRVIYLGFDMEKDQSPYVDAAGSPLKNRKVRQAIYLAIDEEKIIREVLRGHGKPASQFCSPYVFGFNPKIERLPYDPERAKVLLTEAGYADGFKITFHCPNNRYVKDEEIGAMIVQQLKQVGIDAKLRALPKEIFFPQFIEGNYSFFLIGWDCPNGDAIWSFLNCLHTRVPPAYGYLNVGGYSNAYLDSLIEMIEVTMDPVERTRLFEEAQEIGTRDIPWIPLHTQVDIYGVKKDLSFNPRLDKQLALNEIKPAGKK